MTEDTTCDYSKGQPRCGRRGFREVWKKTSDGAWYVLCYKHFVQEKKLSHLFAWGMIDKPNKMSDRRFEKLAAEVLKGRKSAAEIVRDSRGGT